MNSASRCSEAEDIGPSLNCLIFGLDLLGTFVAMTKVPVKIDSSKFKLSAIPLPVWIITAVINGIIDRCNYKLIPAISQKRQQKPKLVFAANYFPLHFNLKSCIKNKAI